MIEIPLCILLLAACFAVMVKAVGLEVVRAYGAREEPGPTDMSATDCVTITSTFPKLDRQPIHRTSVIGTTTTPTRNKITTH